MSATPHLLRVLSNPSIQIDGHLNPHLQTVHLPELPLTGATFHPTGSSILLTGPRPFYYIHDLQSGTTTKSVPIHQGSQETADRSFETRRFSWDGNYLAVAGRGGHVNILDWKGGAQTIAKLKANSPIKSVWWDANSTDHIWTLTQDSMVYVWDMRSSRCLRTWTDEGGYGSQIVSGDVHGKYLATG
jgi:U3 small nucleolar RNA-associated protein 18